VERSLSLLWRKFNQRRGFDINQTLTANELENKISNLFNSMKLIPYIQQYEFETLLFSQPAYYEKYFGEISARVKFVENSGKKGRSG